jgi:hypothetical protein
MPPSPILTVSINPAKLAEVIALLGLEDPPRIHLIRTPPPTRHYGGRTMVVYGEADYARHRVNVYTAIEQFDHERLPFVASEMGRTLLHELRHFHQLQNWSAEEREADQKKHYFTRKAEEDAENFAVQHISSFKTLVRVGRRHPSSNMSRLSATARRATSGRVL